MQYLYLPTAAPVTLTHIALGLFFPRGNVFPVHCPTEKTAVFVGVYNEESLIGEALGSVINQVEPAGEIVISNNGSIDSTLDEVFKTLEDHGYQKVRRRDVTKYISMDKLLHLSKFHCEVDVFESDRHPVVKLVNYTGKTSKADSMNRANVFGLITMPWCLTIDSDTILERDFIHQMNKMRYRLVKSRKGTYEIVKANVLGGTVLTRYNKDAGLSERIIRSARDAEYSFGQIMVRPGQNHTALFVAPGCGFMAATDNLIMSNETVVEDLEFTEVLQAKIHTTSMDYAALRKTLGHDFLEQAFVDTKTGGHVPIKDLLQALDAPIEYTENTARYVPEAFMITQDPKELSSWAVQLVRWNGGLHQVRYLKGDQIRKNFGSVFTFYGAYIEGLIGSLMFFGIPLTLAFMAYGNGGYDENIYLRALVYYSGLDLLVTLVFLTAGFFKRHRLENFSFKKAAKQTVLDVGRCTPAYYLNRAMNSLAYMYGYAINFWDYRVKGVRRWNSEWERPHITEGAKRARENLASEQHD